jgi:hypothetical protein
VVCNAATTARTLPMDGPLLVTGARFRLGALPAVLRTPALDLVDAARPLDDVLDRRAAAAVWQARGDDAPRHVTGYGCGARPGPDLARAQHVIRAIARDTAVAAVRRLVARLAERVPGGADPRVQGALHRLDRVPADPSAAPMARLCRELAVSRRTLERLFAEQVGPRSAHLRAGPARRRGGARARARRVGARGVAVGARAPAGLRRPRAHDARVRTRHGRHAVGVPARGARSAGRPRPEGGVVTQDRPTPLGTVGASGGADGGLRLDA